MVLGLVFACCGSVFFAFGNTLWQFIIARAIVGISFGCTQPAARAVAAHLDKNRAAERLGRLAGMETAGIVGGPFLGGILLDEPVLLHHVERQEAEAARAERNPELGHFGPRDKGREADQRDGKDSSQDAHRLLQAPAVRPRPRYAGMQRSINSRVSLSVSMDQQAAIAASRWATGSTVA